MAYLSALAVGSATQRVSGRPFPKWTGFGPAVCSYTDRPTYASASCAQSL